MPFLTTMIVKNVSCNSSHKVTATAFYYTSNTQRRRLYIQLDSKNGDDTSTMKRVKCVLIEASYDHRLFAESEQIAKKSFQSYTFQSPLPVVDSSRWTVYVSTSDQSDSLLCPGFTISKSYYRLGVASVEERPSLFIVGNDTSLELCHWAARSPTDILESSRLFTVLN